MHDRASSKRVAAKWSPTGMKGSKGVLTLLAYLATLLVLTLIRLVPVQSHKYELKLDRFSWSYTGPSPKLLGLHWPRLFSACPSPKCEQNRTLRPHEYQKDNISYKVRPKNVSTSAALVPRGVEIPTENEANVAEAVCATPRGAFL